MKSILVMLVGASLLRGEEPRRPPITGVAQIAFFAADLEKSRAFYRDFLGFAERSPNLLSINSRQSIQLLPEREPNSDRLSHISIETTNAEAMRVYLRSRGIAVPDGPVLRVKDAEGHEIEFVQSQPGKSTPAAGQISKRMMHVGIIVTAFDAEMKFYTEILGFREIWRGSRSGTELSWVNLKVPDGEDYIEFMLFRNAPPPTGRGTSHHLCLEVPDIEASVAALKPKQYPRPMEIRTGTNRKRQVNLYDPDGTRTELMEPVTVDGKPAPSSTAPPPR